MGQILIVSDNEILNQLYVTNMEVYLGTKAKIVPSAAEAFNLLSQVNYKILITMSMINGQDSAEDVYNHIASLQNKPKIIIIGKPQKELQDVIIVPNSYSLKILIRSCAEILGITAKTMMNKEMDKYYPVENEFLLKLKEIPCTLYLKLNSGEYSIIGKRGDGVQETINKFAKEGINTLYVNALDRLYIINLISESILDFLENTDGLDTAEKSDAVKTGQSFVGAIFNQSPEVNTEIVNIANACTKVMQEIVNESPSLMKLLAILNSQKDGYLYVHSILAAFVCNHIARRVSWGGNSHIEKINFVLFFHDIILAPLYQKYPDLKYEEDLLFSDKLSDKEKETVLNHARLSAEALVSYKRAPIGVDLLIKQHHGITNGIGFTVEYKDDISPISKIILIAESFIEEYFKLKEEDPKAITDTKKIISHLYEKFKRPTYKKIIETLNDFPTL